MVDKQNQILFQIDSIIRKSFYQKPIKGLEVGKPANITLELKFGINKDKSIISTFLKVDFSQKRKKFMGIEIVHNFKVKEKSVFDDCTPDKLKLPQEFLLTLASISISGSRGVLAANNTTAPYNKYYLPLIDPKSLIAMDLEKEK